MDGPPPDAPRVDLLLAGGGLANGLIACRLKAERPDLRIQVVEAADRLGGSHTWSFFETDLDADQRRWVAPLIAHRWPGYEVRFPAHVRRLPTPYCSVSAERFDALVRPALGDALRLNAPIAEVHTDRLVLEGGETLHARAVIDGRGPTATPDLVLGFQKFVGLEVRLEAPHGLTEPVMMDATVDQLGGYRFIYLLPLDETTVLVEDTRYTDGAELDRVALRRGVEIYIRQQGWRVAEVIRSEEGVLPVALGGDLEAHLHRLGPTAPSGLRAGLFHPTTGYSLPDAVRMADAFVAMSWSDGADLAAQVRARALETWSDRGFYRLLNRLLFRAAKPEERYKVFQRFYRLSPKLIERFYSGRSTAGDKLRILSGRPPVPISAALPHVFERERSL